MIISRRHFIQTASIAAIAAATLSKPGLLSLAQANKDPLAYYTQATFTQYLNSIFRISGASTVDAMLEKVVDTLPATFSRDGGRECFMLYFRGGAVQLTQDTYMISHPALGTFHLFLVPAGADENGAQAYTATINRLEYAARGRLPKSPRAITNTSAPTKSSQPAAPESKSPEPAQPSQRQIKPLIRKIDPDRPVDPDN